MERLASQILPLNLYLKQNYPKNSQENLTHLKKLSVFLKIQKIHLLKKSLVSGKLALY